MLRPFTLAGGFVAFLSGGFLLAYWWQDRMTWTAFWWGLANAGLGIGVSLLALRPVVPVYISNIVAPPLLDLCAALAFVAARIFNRGSVDPFRIAVGLVAWIVMVIVAGILTKEQFAAALGVGDFGRSLRGGRT